VDEAVSNAKVASEKMCAVEFTQRGRTKKKPRVDKILGAALQTDEDLFRNGDGKTVKKLAETWRDRAGVCSPKP